MADLERLLREQHPELGQPRVPVPQYQKVDGIGYEKLKGQYGGAFSVLLGPNGQPISSGNPLPVQQSGNIDSGSGLHANRPSASSVKSGYLYFSVDKAEDKLSYSDGSSWKVVE